MARTSLCDTLAADLMRASLTKRRAPFWALRLPKVATGCLSVLGTVAFAANLSVTVDNIKENKGTVHVVIYDAPNWMSGDPDNFAGSQSVDISERKDDGPLVTDVELEPGEYGAFVYHDLNANFKFDKNLIRMPKEPYAFSGPFNKLRMPKFKDCRFVVGEDGAAIRVGLQK